jgi:hypothetical protein
MIETEDEILYRLDQLRQHGGEVSLLSIYKGMPLSNTTRVLEVNGREALVHVSSHVATCLKMRNPTFIQSEALPSVVRCYAVTVQFANETARLASFDYTSSEIGQRSIFRVQPKDPVQVELNIRDAIIRGTLLDLSIRGAGIQTGAIYIEDRFLRKGTPVLLTIQNLTPSPLKSAGTLMNLHRKATHLRLGMTLEPDQAIYQVLWQYVNRRQAEIQHELIKMFEAFQRMGEGG